jgi:alkylhydroperoxidase family enzyme
MADSPPRPRVEPLSIDEMSTEALEILAGSVVNDNGTIRPRRDDDPVHPYPAIMLRFPKLYKRFGVFAGQVLTRGVLSVRDRELVCLRVGWLCQGALEFGEHVTIAHTVGFSADDVERVVAGPNAPGWSERDRALLSAVDELHHSGTVSDSTWAVLAPFYDEKQLIELPYLVGAYHTVAFAQNALKVPLPPGNRGLAAR